jgi:hypothetical protein
MVKMLKSAIVQYNNNTIMPPMLRRTSANETQDTYFEKMAHIKRHIYRINTQVYTISKFYKGEQYKLKMITKVLDTFNVDILLTNKVYSYLCETKCKDIDFTLDFPQEESQPLYYQAPLLKKMLYYFKTDLDTNVPGWDNTDNMYQMLYDLYENENDYLLSFR